MDRQKTIQLSGSKVQEINRQMEARITSWQQQLKKLKSKSKDVFELVEQSLYSIVAIYVIEWETEKILNVGSGFFVEPDLIVSNYRIVSEIAKESTIFDEDESQLLLISTHTGELRLAEVVFTSDKKTDLALILITDSIIDQTMGMEVELVQEYPYLELGFGLEKGERVFAVGQPVGKFTSTVNEGSIQNIVAPEKTKGKKGQKDKAITVSLLETDAKIDLGNSGGPLMNLAGRVIGVNSWQKTEEDGYNVAIAADVLGNFLEEFESAFDDED